MAFQNSKSINAFNKGGTMKILAILMLLVLNVACSSQERKYESPPALAELVRRSHLNDLTNATDPAIGEPSYQQRVSMTCTQTPIYDMWGYFVRTDVICW